MIDERSEVMERTQELLTVQEVARIFRVDETTVRRWASRGAIEVEWASRPGKRKSFLIKRASIEKWLTTPLVPGGKHG